LKLSVLSMGGIVGGAAIAGAVVMSVDVVSTLQMSLPRASYVPESGYLCWSRTSHVESLHGRGGPTSYHPLLPSTRLD
jgi:hypothetical protein